MHDRTVEIRISILNFSLVLMIDRIHMSLFSCFMLIILTGLVGTNEIQNNFCFKERMVRALAQRQKTNFLGASYEHGFLKYYSALHPWPKQLESNAQVF